MDEEEIKMAKRKYTVKKIRRFDGKEWKIFYSSTQKQQALEWKDIAKGQGNYVRLEKGKFRDISGKIHNGYNIYTRKEKAPSFLTTKKFNGKIYNLRTWGGADLPKHIAKKKAKDLRKENRVRVISHKKATGETVYDLYIRKGKRD
jgi:hypothetical protein